MIIALGRHLLESTIFVMLVGVAVLFFRKRSAAVHHVLWLAAAAKFVLPVAAFSLLGASLGQLLPTSAISASFRSVFQGAGIPTASMPSMPRSIAISNALIAVWLGGAAVMLAIWLLKIWRSFERPRGVENSHDVSLIRLKQRMGLRREVSLRFLDSVLEPVLVGFWKPSIALPTGLSESLTPAELESVILHELAHAKRWDNWTAAFTHIVTCIFWFYPLLWWIEKRVHRERELACDEMVIHYGAAPKDYVAGILKVCRHQLGASVAGISGVCASNLKSRMEVIMSLSPNAGLLRSSKVLFGSLFGIVVLLPLAFGFLTTSNSYGQAAKKSGNQPTIGGQFSCTYASVAYPEGTVIQVANLPEEMCARVLLNPANPKDPNARLTYRPEWIPTDEAIRERSDSVVHLPEPPLVSCTPAASTQKNLCACREGGNFSSNALVNSAVGPFQLRCDRGHWVQAPTPNVVRK